MQWIQAILRFMHCPLCQHPDVEDFSPETGPRELFFRCRHCDLIFKNSKVYLPPIEEKKRYDTHQNHDTPDYRKFLSLLIEPVLPFINPHMRSLDFGCGPNPLLAKMLAENGLPCEFYDPLYFPKLDLLANTYDFIFCSEVVEHFYDPNKEWNLLRKLLKRNGTLAVMTQPPPADFANWYYHRDPTHVVFYSEQTMLWLATFLDMKLSTYPKGVWLFRNG